MPLIDSLLISVFWRSDLFHSTIEILRLLPSLVYPWIFLLLVSFVRLICTQLRERTSMSWEGMGLIHRFFVCTCNGELIMDTSTDAFDRNYEVAKLLGGYLEFT